VTGRGVTIQGGLALLVLVLAYTTWQRPPEKQVGEVFVLDITKNDLDKVRFEDQEGKSWSELAKGKDDDGTFISLRLSGFDSTGAALPSGHPGIALKQPERLIRANETGQKLFERFAPLRAQRSLGVLDAAKLKELGLDKTKKFVEVTARGRKRRFAIVSAPPGGDSPYIQDTQDKKVYIVPRAVLSDLQAASTNLPERRLHAFRIEEVDKLTLTSGGKTREFVGSRIEDFPGIRLAPVATPDKHDATLKNWNDRVFNLFPTEVLGQGEVPSAGAPNLVIRLEYFSRGRRIGWTELGRSPAPAAPAVSTTTTTTPPPAQAFARSEFTLGWFKLAGDAQALINEAETLAAKK
jgi:hypothetical protein